MARADSRIPSLEVVEARLLKEQKRHRNLKFSVISLCILVTAAATAALIAVLFLQILRIDGTSMADTLRERDLVIAHNTFGADRGDVIAFYHGEDILVKRVIATAGDTVDIGADGTVTVNGEPLEEPYLTQKALGRCNIELPCQVPEGRYFVMGDHRTVSIDSRSQAVGCVAEEDIIGKIILRIWPIKDFSLVR